MYDRTRLMIMEHGYGVTIGAYGIRRLRFDNPCLIPQRSVTIMRKIKFIITILRMNYNCFRKMLLVEC